MRARLLAVASGLALALALLMIFEERLIFFPERGGVGPSPGVELWLPSAAQPRVHGWYLQHPGARATLLHLHGNAGNLEHRRELVTMLAAQGVNVLAIDYRGYGKSPGEFPSERSVSEDARTAYEYLRAAQPRLPIVVHGESLGGGAACNLAVQAEIAALILQSAFTSIPAMSETVYPFLPVQRLLRTRFDNLGKIAHVKVPKLFIHSRRDEIIPFAMGEALFAAASAPKQQLWLARSGHNDAPWVEGEALFGAIRGFLRQYRLAD